MPFSTPPEPSEPPNSRILTPLTGNANKPLAEAKAIAGLSRAESFSPPRFGLPFGATGAPRRLALAAALRRHVFFDGTLFSLPLVDERGEPGLVIPEFVAINRKLVALGSDVLANRDQFAEVGGQSVRTSAQFGHNGSEQHRRAKRLQRVFRPYQQGWRHPPSRALQGSQHLDNFRTARTKRTANLLLARVERAQPRFGVAYPGLDAAHLSGDVDQPLIELAVILTDRCEIGLELHLQFRGALLLRAGGFEFLLALFDRVR